VGLSHRIRATLRSWFRSAHIDDDLEQELAFHVERERQANEEAGLSPAEALRAARLTVGGVDAITDVSRATRPGALLRQIARDIAYAMRLFRTSPGFAATAVLVVALGVATTTAAFSVLYGVVLRPLPYPDADRLVGLWTRSPVLVGGQIRGFVNAADAAAWRTSNRVFDGIALVRNVANFNLTGAGTPERLLGARTSPNFLTVLGVRPLLGRGFVNGEDQDGRDHVVLLSHRLWLRRFAGDSHVLGREITLNGERYAVVGVMPAAFDYPGREFELWVPLTVNPAELSRVEPGFQYLAVARLEPGVTLESAQHDMDAIAADLARRTPATNRDVRFEVLPLLDDALQPVRPSLYLVFGAAACLLLISCLNLASLFSTRAVVRTREYTVRLALGASRARLLVQVLVEALPALLAGGLIGIGGAMAAVAAFVAAVPPTVLPRTSEIHVDAPVLVFALAVVTLTGALAALRPALAASRSHAADAMRDASRTSAGGRAHTRAMNGIVMGQVALVLPLLVVTMLLTRSFVNVLRVDPGFTPDHLLSMQLAISRATYRSDRQVAEFCARLLARVSSLPGVVSAGMVNRLPLGGAIQTLPFLFDQPGVAPVPADSRTITPGYFVTMGIPVLEGRDFTDHDVAVAPIPAMNATFPIVGIVDERLARTVWPGESAVGHRFRLPFPDAPWVEVVGVVGHIHHDGLEVDPRPQVYFNFRQRAQDRMALVVRGSGDVRALEAPIRRAIYDLDADQPMYDVRTMDDVVSRSTAQRRLSVMIVVAFAVCALTLAGAGLYGAVLFGVTRRTREFGIRMALGARPSDIGRLVLRRGALITAAGVVMGLGLSWPVAHAMSTLLFGMRAFDGLSLGGATVGLIAVALVASYVPARHAAAVDPSVTLRAE
jgi:putative ABC transport system permease protein